jgi:hypothetical protein
MATIKQKRAFKEALENGGVVSRAMKTAGYSDSVAKNPKKLTDSIGWKELMDEYLPDKLLAKRHLALLNKTEGKTGQPETMAVSKGLDMAYKLKGKYAPEKQDITTDGKPLVNEDELRALSDKFNEFLKRSGQA